MICPKCGRPVEESAVICRGCDFILDTEFLGEGILDEEHSLRPGAGGVDPAAFNLADAVILGNIDEDSQSFETSDSGFHMQANLSARLYVSGRSQALMSPDAVPAIAKPTTDGVRLTPFERHVLAFIDGKRPVEFIRRAAGLDEAEVKTALATLADKGVVKVVGRALADFDPGMETAVRRAPVRRGVRGSKVGAVALVGDEADRAIDAAFRTQVAIAVPLVAESERPTTKPQAAAAIARDSELPSDVDQFIGMKGTDEVEQRREHIASTLRPATQKAAVNRGKNVAGTFRAAADPAESSQDGIDASADGSVPERPRIPSGQGFSALPEGTRLPTDMAVGLSQSFSVGPDTPALPEPSGDVPTRIPEPPPDPRPRPPSLSLADFSFEGTGQSTPFAKPSLRKMEATGGELSNQGSLEPSSRGAEGARRALWRPKGDEGEASAVQRGGASLSRMLERESPSQETAPPGPPPAKPSPTSRLVDAAELERKVELQSQDSFDESTLASSPRPPPETKRPRQPQADALPRTSFEGAQPPPLPADASGVDKQNQDDSDTELVDSDLLIRPATKGAPAVAARVTASPPGSDASEPSFTASAEVWPSAPAAVAVGSLSPAFAESASIPRLQPSDANRRKGRRLFEEAQKEAAAGRMGAALMNAKLASIYDPDSDAYRVQLEAWEQQSARPHPHTASSLTSSQAASDESQAEIKALYDQAQRHEDDGDIDAALAVLTNGLGRFPGAAAFHNRIGVILALRKRDYDGAVDAIQRAIDIDPDNLHYKSNLGKIVAKLRGPRMEG